MGSLSGWHEILIFMLKEKAMEIHLGGMRSARQVTKVCFYLISSLTLFHSSTHSTLTSAFHFTKTYHWLFIVKSQRPLCRPLCFGQICVKYDLTQPNTSIFSIFFPEYSWLLKYYFFSVLPPISLIVLFNTSHPFHFFSTNHFMSILLHFIISLSHSSSYHWCHLY